MILALKENTVRASLENILLVLYKENKGIKHTFPIGFKAGYLDPFWETTGIQIGVFLTGENVINTACFRFRNLKVTLRGTSMWPLYSFPPFLIYVCTTYFIY